MKRLLARLFGGHPRVRVWLGGQWELWSIEGSEKRWFRVMNWTMPHEEPPHPRCVPGIPSREDHGKVRM